MPILISELLTMSEVQCFDFCASQLPSPLRVDGDYLYQAGDPDSTVMLVAHLDTASNPLTRKALRISRCGNVLTSDGKTCLGADDRAGVYAMLKIYNAAEIKPHLLFTCKEEVGGIGAQAFCKNTALVAELSVKLHIMIELDRKGASEWVTYDDAIHRDLEEWVEGFSFTCNHGTYSDIATIGPYIRVPSVNLSIGYYAQHTNKERLHVDEMEMTVTRVLQMLSDPPPKTAYIEETRRRWGHLDRWAGDDWLLDDGKEPAEGYTRSSFDFSISALIEGLISADGLCDECELPWQECTCGRMARIIEDYLTEDEALDLCDEIPDAPVIASLDFMAWHGSRVTNY